MRTALFGILLLSVGVPALAQDGCRLEFASGPQTINLDAIEVGDGNVSRRQFSLRIRSDGSERCSGFLRVTRSAAFADTEMPAYRFVTAGQTIDVFPREAAGVPLTGDMPITADAAAEGQPVDFEILMPSDWGIKSGQYGEQLTFSLVGSGGELFGESTVSLNVLVPASVNLRLFGATGNGLGPARIDLGELSASKATISQPFGVRVWSTSPHVVSMISANQGNLLHVEGTEKIPYQLIFDQQRVDLTAQANFVAAQHTPSGGNVHHLSIAVPPVKALAGDYSDRLTITVTAM